MPICPIFHAGREEIATAIYQVEQSGWHQLTAEHITTVDALCSQITAETVFCGEFVPSIADRLREQLGQKAIILPPAAGMRRAAFLAELGLKRFKAGDYDDVVTLQPFYLRGPAITQPKHRWGKE